MANTQSIRNQCKNKILVDLVGCDFDETISLKDTIDSLGNLAEKFNKNNSNRKPWAYFTDEYIKDYSAIKPDLEKKFKGSISSLDPNASNQAKFNILIDYINSLKQIEHNSLNRINAAKHFSNLTTENIRDLCKTIELRPGFDSILKGDKFKILNKFTSTWSQFNVISVNWSKDFILSCINSRIPINRIYANDFNKDPSTGVTDGTIEVEMVDGVDKLNLWNKLIDQTKAKTTLFIGDSLNDLPPLLQSTYGIIIGNNTKLIEICKLLDVKVFNSFNDYNNYTNGWKLLRIDQYY